METMARRVQIQLVILFFLLTLVLQGQLDPSNVLVSYSFDDQELATGPDTFAVFEKARGSVQMTTEVRFSGYRSLEIRDVADDGDFPELQGYFKLRFSGKLYLHFALMTASPFEELNIALAGPEWFKLRKNGIGFWLRTREGNLYQYSDSMPKKLLPIEAFVWYGVDVAYDISAGAYDLIIHREGQEKPLVSLKQQANAANHQGSAVDKFSFIGDTGEDKSNVTYYVDDVVIGTDERIVQVPFVAPGRRKLFVDYWSDSQRNSRGQPVPLDIMDPSDLGVGPKEVESLKADGVWELLLQMTGGQRPRSVTSSDISSESGRLLQAVSSWSNGCEALRRGEAAAALGSFEKAESLVPAGKIFDLNAVLSLAALGRWQDVDARLSAIHAEWQNDLRFPAALAMIGLARQDLELAEGWLRPHAESVPDEIGLDLIRRVRSGPLSTPGLDEVRRQFPESWQDAVRDAWVAEQYFFVLLWKGQPAAAQQFARRMVDRYQRLGISKSKWLERMGDAAFFQNNFSEALDYYESSLKESDDAGTLVKVSDVYFRLGDFEKERLYREKIYGSLRQK